MTWLQRPVGCTLTDRQGSNLHLLTGMSAQIKPQAPRRRDCRGRRCRKCRSICCKFTQDNNMCNASASRLMSGHIYAALNRQQLKTAQSVLLPSPGCQPLSSFPRRAVPVARPTEHLDASREGAFTSLRLQRERPAVKQNYFGPRG